MTFKPAPPPLRWARSQPSHPRLSQELRTQLSSLKNGVEPAASKEPTSEYVWVPNGGAGLHGTAYPPNLAYQRGDGVPWGAMSRAERSMAINRMYDDPYSLRQWLDQVTESPRYPSHSEPRRGYYGPTPAWGYDGFHHQSRVAGAYPDGRYI